MFPRTSNTHSAHCRQLKVPASLSPFPKWPPNKKRSRGAESAGRLSQVCGNIPRRNDAEDALAGSAVFSDEHHADPISLPLGAREQGGSVSNSG